MSAGHTSRFTPYILDEVNDVDKLVELAKTIQIEILNACAVDANAVKSIAEKSAESLSKLKDIALSIQTNTYDIADILSEPAYTLHDTYERVILLSFEDIRNPELIDDSVFAHLKDADFKELQAVYDKVTLSIDKLNDEAVKWVYQSDKALTALKNFGEAEDIATSMLIPSLILATTFTDAICEIDCVQAEVRNDANNLDVAHTRFNIPSTAL